VRYDLPGEKRRRHRRAQMSQDKKQGRKLGFAILISLILHLAVGFSLAAFGNVFTPVLPVDEEPAELTLMDLSATPPPEKNVPFLETDASKESAEKPKEQSFESNANSLAASERPATGTLPLPSQDGQDKPFLDLDTRNYSLPTDGSQPQPERTPAPEKKPTEPPKPSATPAALEPDQLAMLTSTPPPPIKAPEETEPTPPPEVAASTTPVPRPQPEKPASNYQSQKQQTRIEGTITTRGPSSVNAVGTPLGRYQKQLYDAVGARWYQHMERRRDVIGIGTLRLSFTIDRSGRVSDLKLLENTANEAFASVCLQSIQEVKLPPIPDDVAASLPPEGLQQVLTFISYAN
jgi:outer membrane biosynthesis protein TonB